jgi:GNAT superfamily N-acetyltransferase
MSKILQDLSPAALVQAIEANLFEIFLTFRHWPQSEVHNDPDMLWAITDIPFPLFNSVLHARLAPGNADLGIEKAIARCRSRNVPMMWWTGPATRPGDLGARLEAHGLAHEEDLGMAADLMTLNEGLPAPSGLMIEQVNDRETLEQWCHVVTVGFGFPDFVAPCLFDWFASLGFEADLPLRNYLGRLNGEPVAASTLLVGAGVAGIYDVATIPAARRQGIGAAITLRPLCDARAMGYRVGVLDAMDMGAGLYRRLGFREYCKIGTYVWEGKPANQR